MNLDFSKGLRACHDEIKRLLRIGVPKKDVIDSLEWLSRPDFTDEEEEIYLSLMQALYGQGPKHERF